MYRLHSTLIYIVFTYYARSAVIAGHVLCIEDIVDDSATEILTASITLTMKRVIEIEHKEVRVCLIIYTHITETL